MRSQETSRWRHGTPEPRCKCSRHKLHHENVPAAEGVLLDTLVDTQARNWEQMWIDLGGEG